jgi:LacI family transcriptional regulator
MTEATRERVLQAAKDLDYHPNWLARGLRRLRTDTIGLIVPDIENPFFTSVVKGVERAAAARGWNVVLGNTDEDHDREERLVRAMVERKIDGLILSPAMGPHDHLARCVERRFPMVMVNRVIDELPIPAVAANNCQGAYEATRHLLQSGAVPLGVIVGTPGLSTTESRLAGCRQAAAECGVRDADLVIGIGYGRMAQGYTAAQAFLGQTPRPRGIFAFNNLMAEAALMAIHDRGLSCPEDVALIGFDDFRSAAALSPALTMVDQQPVEMGKAALEELARRIETGCLDRSLTLIPTRLMIRASCGCQWQQSRRAGEAPGSLA